MRADYLQDIPEYAERWETLMTRMIQENTWKVVKYEKYPNHFLGRDGLLMVFQVNKWTCVEKSSTIKANISRKFNILA